MSVDQMVGKIAVVDTVDASLDRLLPIRLLLLPANCRIDPVVNVRLGMIGVIGLTFGELRRQVQ